MKIDFVNGDKAPFWVPSTSGTINTRVQLRFWVNMVSLYGNTTISSKMDPLKLSLDPPSSQKKVVFQPIDAVF